MAQDPTHVPILMGTLNGAAHLRGQLASIRAQSHANWSLWISDDGSSDGTQDMLATFARTTRQPVRLLAGPRRGVAANYLRLLSHPDLPFGPVAFADQDDLWQPDHLARGLAALARHAGGPAGAAYSAPGLAVDADLRPRARPRPFTRGASFANALVENILAGNGLMLDARASDLARQGGAPDVPFWDWWLYLLLSGQGSDLVLDPRPGLFYRAHGANQLGPRVGPRAALRRVARLLDGSYGRWIGANLAALEPHLPNLTPASQMRAKALMAARQGRPRARALRRLGALRQTRHDQLALWISGQLGRV